MILGPGAMNYLSLLRDSRKNGLIKQEMDYGKENPSRLKRFGVSHRGAGLPIDGFSDVPILIRHFD